MKQSGKVSNHDELYDKKDIGMLIEKETVCANENRIGSSCFQW